MGYSGFGHHYLVDTSLGFFVRPNNVFGTDPNFVDAPSSDPGPPDCAGSDHVVDCMADIIADFVAQAPEAEGRGYQTPGPPAYDPLFPQWLCNVNLPEGLVRMGCVAPPSRPAPPTLLGVTVQ